MQNKFLKGLSHCKGFFHQVLIIIKKRFFKKQISCYKRLGIIIIGSIIFTMMLIAVRYYVIVFTSNVPQKKTVYIPKGTDFKNFIKIIQPAVEDIKSFRITCKLKEYTKNIQSGKYVFSAQMSNNDLINLLRSGKQTPVNIIFHNKHSLPKLAGAIAKQIQADSLSLIKVFTDTLFLRVNNFTPQTALSMYIPNTYQMFWDADAHSFRKRMLKEYLYFWNENRKKQAQDKKLTPTQVMILAAIVQRESSYIPERATIAGLYLNRLRKGIPLQADPTIVFALKQKKTDSTPAPIKRVYHKDLEIKSPYNTYKNRGLPPGIIAMPDISSIDAVLNAPLHSYLYMCADSKNIGKHVFAKNLKDHNKNYRAYRKWLEKNNIR